MENEQSLSLLFWVSTSVMLLLAIGFLFITFIYHKKTSSIKQKESENLLRATLETEKNERHRIASDFHDSVSGDLSAIRNFINILYQKESNNQDKPVLNEIKHSLDIMMTNVKHINYNLMPPLLDSLGFLPALKDFADRTQRLNNIKISTQFRISKLNITTSTAYQLFRILQEITSNALKHNEVSQISFEVCRRSDDVIIEITDDGHAFNFFKNLKQSRGLGLKNILSRINNINAVLEQVEATNGNKLIIKIDEKS
jgi:signal transduction histidine kinase